MARRKTLANLNCPGLVDPGEYPFEAQFLELAEQYGQEGQRYVEVDTGKVLGLARAYARMLQQRTGPLTRRVVRGGGLVESDTARGE